MDPNFLVLDSIGLYCQAGDFYIDPQKAVPLAVVSHAHADHAVPGSDTVHATPGTLALMQARYGKKTGKHLIPKPYGERFKIKDIEICFYPAGHILGSAQVLLIHKNIRYLYTGDLKLQEDRTCEPYQFIKADVLITETTFADPQKAHPSVEEEIQKIGACPHHILLGAYALGKAQRMTALINTHCPNKTVLVHHAIGPFHRVYEQYGIALDWAFYDRKRMKQEQDLVYIVPPITYRSYLKAIEVQRMFVTGWEHKQASNDILLRISDHIDWQDLLYIIERCDPQEIWTLHGDGQYVAAHFAGKKHVKALNA